MLINAVEKESQAPHHVRGGGKRWGAGCDEFSRVWLRLPPAQSGSRFNTLTFDTFDAKSGFLAILFIFI
jgi:hypothetical protein